MIDEIEVMNWNIKDVTPQINYIFPFKLVACKWQTLITQNSGAKCDDRKRFTFIPEVLR